LPYAAKQRKTKRFSNAGMHRLRSLGKLNLFLTVVPASPLLMSDLGKLTLSHAVLQPASKHNLPRTIRGHFSKGGDAGR